jgi:predicted esterase
MRARALVLSAAVAVTSFTTGASAVPRTKVPGVCSGCLASVSGTGDTTNAPTPLLVTLHGDWGITAPELHAAWERFAAPRGIALLSLTCPVDLGCKRSWWEWNGDPTWITEQVARLAARHAIDPERLWIAGWSGGATYLGMRTQELERTFVGLVLHGGGHRPMRAGCAPEKSAVVFLAGDQNPLHERVLKLREHYEACGNDVTFTLLRGAEHEAEWRALDRQGGPILDLLATKRRVAVASPPPAATAPAPMVPAVTTPAPPPPPPPERLPARGGCACELSTRAPGPPWLAGLALGCALAALTRACDRRRRESPVVQSARARRMVEAAGRRPETGASSSRTL